MRTLAEGLENRMDVEEAKYVVRYYSELLSDHEKKVIKQATSYLVLSPETLGELLKELNWVDHTADTSRFFNMDHAPFSITNDSFDVLIATKILEKHRDHVYLNHCPKCNQLARTPFAKQCRCGYGWHDIKNS